MSNRNAKGQFVNPTADCRSDKRDLSEQLASLKERLHADRLDVVEYVAELPSNIRESVLWSLTGSVNASIIGTAQAMIRKLEADGETQVSELSTTEIEHMLTGPDWIEGTNYARNVNAIAMKWRDDLVALSNQKSAGSLGQAIDFKINSPRTVDDKLLASLLAAANIEDVDPKMIKAVYDAKQQRRSEEVAKQRGDIERLIDIALNPEHVMAGANMYDLVDGDYAEADFFALSEQQQEALTEKLSNALVKTRDSAILKVLERHPKWSFGDVPIIASCIKEVQQHL